MQARGYGGTNTRSPRTAWFFSQTLPAGNQRIFTSFCNVWQPGQSVIAAR